MNHLDPIPTALAHRIPVPFLCVRLTERRLLPGRGQDHLLVVVHGVDPLAITRDGEGMAELLAAVLVRLICQVVFVGQGACPVGARGTAQRGQVAVGMTGDTTDHGVDHGDVADDDGDEGLSTGPATGLGGAIGTGLIR